MLPFKASQNTFPQEVYYHPEGGFDICLPALLILFPELPGAWWRAAASDPPAALPLPFPPLLFTSQLPFLLPWICTQFTEQLFSFPIFIYRPNSIKPTIKEGKSPTMPPPCGVNSLPSSAPFQACPGTKLAIIFTELWFPFCLPRPPDGLGGGGRAPSPSFLHPVT